MNWFIKSKNKILWFASPFLFALAMVALLTHLNRPYQVEMARAPQSVEDSVKLFTITTDLLPGDIFQVSLELNAQNQIENIHLSDSDEQVNDTYTIAQLREGADFNVPPGVSSIDVNPVGIFKAPAFTAAAGGRVQLSYPDTVIPRSMSSVNFQIMLTNGQWHAVDSSNRSFSQATLVTNTIPIIDKPIGISGVDFR